MGWERNGMCLTGMHKVLGLISSITEREKKDFIEGTIVSSCNFQNFATNCCETAIASNVYCYDNYPSYSKFYGFCSFLCSREKRLKTKYTAMFPRESIIAESKHTTAGRGRFL